MTRFCGQRWEGGATCKWEGVGVGRKGGVSVAEETIRTIADVTHQETFYETREAEPSHLADQHQEDLETSERWGLMGSKTQKKDKYLVMSLKTHPKLKVRP